MIDVTVSDQQTEHSLDHVLVSDFVVRAAEMLECRADEISVAFVDEEQIRNFNNRYRGMDRVTDVLSFALEPDPGPDGSTNLGDLVICPARALDQANQAGHDLWTEISILILHCLLHLLVMDHPEHADEPGESEMELEERRLRRLLLDD
jgi:probable rRNA maturation factor